VTDTNGTESQEPDQVASQPVQVQEATDGVLVKFDYRYLRELLVDQDTRLPPELQARLVDVLVDRARTNQAVST